MSHSSNIPKKTIVQLITPVVTEGIRSLDDVHPLERDDLEIRHCLIDQGPASIESEFDEALSLPGTIRAAIEAQRSGANAIVTEARTMFEGFVKNLLAVSIAASIMVSTRAASAQEPALLEEIIVTARHRRENMQDIPDNVTVFSSAKIEQAGISELNDFINLTPGVIARETFRAGVTFITIRGVTSGQQGWPPVTYIVDGVKAGSLDAINGAALTDIERIEVLKGPQGALYGAGAIGGAINVVTKAPTNEAEHAIKLSLGKGNDKSLSAMSSGAISEDKLLYRVNVFYRDTDGLIDSTSDDDLDFEEEIGIRSRLIFYPSDGLTVDFRAAYTDITAGAAFQEKIASVDLIEEFYTPAAPGPARGIIGDEDRTFADVSLKIDWEFGGATLTSVTGYQDLDQDLFGSVSWEKPPTLNSLFGEVFGDAAVAGQAIDDFQDLSDDFETFTQDLRLTSSADSAFRWVVGADLLEREAITQLGVGRLMGPVPGTLLRLLNRFDERNDSMRGVYGQINYDVSDRLELTVAGRYDENTYDTRQFDPETGATIPTTGTDGNPVDKLEKEDSKFQPKVQLSYSMTDDVLIYVTWAKGFRTGFFNTGNPSAAESTENYEIGIKSTVAGGHVRINGAVYRIDYTQQQNTQVIATPPFRITRNIPESEITGAELEAVAQLSDHFVVELGLSYTDTEIVGQDIGTPTTPDWTRNLAVQFDYPIANDLDLLARVDYRFQGEMFLNLEFPTPTNPGFEELYNIRSKEYINARLGIGNDIWSITAFGKNLTNERQATDLAVLGGLIRSFNKPRTYGVEFAYRF